MRINGWHRLWLVVSGLYLAVVVLVTFTYSPFPNIERVSHREEFWDRFPKTSKEKLLIWENAIPVTDPKSSELNKKNSKAPEKWEDVKPESVSMPNGYELHFLPEATKQDIKESSARYIEILKEEVFAKRIDFLFTTFLVWIVPCIVVYAIGWSCGWVYRGFKTNAP